MFIYFLAQFIERGSNRWVFYHRWSKWWTPLEIESSFTNRFYIAFLKWSEMNCSSAKLKWNRGGLWVLWARKVAWQYNPATPQSKIRFSSTLERRGNENVVTPKSSLDTITGKRILWKFSKNFFLHIEKNIPSCLACCDQRLPEMRVRVYEGVGNNPIS